MIGEVIGEVIVKPFFEIVCYFIGRLVVPILSLGTVRVARFSDKEWPKGKTFWRDPSGKRVMDGELASLIGLIVIALPIGIWIWIYLGR